VTGLLHHVNATLGGLTALEFLHPRIELNPQEVDIDPELFQPLNVVDGLGKHGREPQGAQHAGNKDQQPNFQRPGGHGGANRPNLAPAWPVQGGRVLVQ